MFLSKLFKRTKNKVMIAIAGFTMVLGTGAAISTVAATQQNEVVETKAASAVTYDGTGQVYLYLNNNYWWNDSARIWLYVFNGTTNATARLSQIDGGQYYKTVVPSGSWTNFIFVRIINTDDFTWDDNYKKHQTQDLDAPVLTETNRFNLTSWSSAGVGDYYDAPDSDGWFLVGNDVFRSSIGTSGNDWVYTTGFKMTPDQPSNQAKTLGINLKKDSQLKARWWSGTTGGWCSSVSVDTGSGATGFSVNGSGNIEISSTRHYDLYYQNGGNLYITNSKRTVTFDANGHGTAPSALENVIDGNTISAPTAPTATGYTFGGWYKEEGCSNAWTFASDVVSADITLYAKWTVIKYAVTIVGGTGISSVYLSTSSSATSGSASGTTFDYGATVYGFVVLSAGYAHQNTWARVSGTDDTSGAKYRVGSLTVATSGNAFGTKTPISGESFAIAWATGFNKAIRGDDGGVCDSDGNTSTSSLATAWGGQSSAYAALAGYKQYWLAEATKSGDSNVTTALAQYDYVCGKYGPNGQKVSGITDFLGRDPKPKSAGVIPGAPRHDQSPLTATLWIVLGAGILGLGAIGTAYFVSKKKKRHQA